MMILYLDTSALVKRYFKEPYSGQLSRIWASAAEIVVSAVGYAEAMAAFHRKKRESSLAQKQVKTIIGAFQEDWDSFIRIGISGDLNSLIDEIVSAYPLRGFDAIHLASALLVKRRMKEDFLFCCFDDRLSDAARKEGLETFPTL